MTIVVHHLANSRSQRILWLLEELQIRYDVKRYERDPVTNLAPRELKDVHPLGKAPVIQDGSVTLAETAVIIEHLVHRAGRLGRPAAPDVAARYDFFMHYAEGSLIPPLYALLVLGRMGEVGQAAAEGVRGVFAGHLAWLDGEIGSRPWIAGNEFTAADVMMSFPMEAARQRGGLDGRYTNLNVWLARIHARPSYRRALEAGGPYALVQ